MAISKVFKQGTSLVFVLHKGLRRKYGIAVGDIVDYKILKNLTKQKEINVLVEGMKVRNLATSLIVTIPSNVCKSLEISEKDTIEYDIENVWRD